MSGQKSKIKKTIEKNETTNSWSFEQINKINKLLARFIKKNRETIQINKTRNEREGRTNTTENHKILPWTICANKLDNLEETDKFPEKYNLPVLYDEENMNRWITSKEVQSIMKPPKIQKSRTRWLHWKILPNFQRRFYTFLLLSQKIKEEGLLSKSLYQGEGCHCLLRG